MTPLSALWPDGDCVCPSLRAKGNRVFTYGQHFERPATKAQLVGCSIRGLFMKQKNLAQFFFGSILIFSGIVAVLVVINRPAPPVLAESTQDAEPPPLAQAALISYPERPSLTNLGQNFLGTDAQQYYETAAQVYYNPAGDLSEDEKRVKYIATIATNFSKSQFETDAQLKSRLVDAIKTNPDFHFLSEYVIFTVEVEYPSYDAEKQQYTVSLLSNKKLKRVSVNEPSYTASTAFGVSTEVTKRSANYYYIEPTNDVPFDVVFSMSPKEAEASQSDMAILYVLKPQFPYVGTFYHHKKPTLNSPKEFTAMVYNIFGNVAEYAIYNKKTGAVLFQRELP